MLIPGSLLSSERWCIQNLLTNSRLLLVCAWLLQVSDGITIADIAVAAVLQPLLSGVLGAEARAPFPETMRWFAAMLQQEQVAAALGKAGVASRVGAG